MNLLAMFAKKKTEDIKKKLGERQNKENIDKTVLHNYSVLRKFVKTSVAKVFFISKKIV